MRRIVGLNDVELAVLILRFGLAADGSPGPDPPQTIDRVAKRFGVSREHIRQIEEKALRRLRRDAALPDWFPWWQGQLGLALGRMPWREPWPGEFRTEAIERFQVAREVLRERGELEATADPASEKVYEA